MFWPLFWSSWLSPREAAQLETLLAMLDLSGVMGGLVVAEGRVQEVLEEREVGRAVEMVVARARGGKRSRCWSPEQSRRKKAREEAEQAGKKTPLKRMRRAEVQEERRVMEASLGLTPDKARAPSWGPLQPVPPLQRSAPSPTSTPPRRARPASTPPPQDALAMLETSCKACSLCGMVLTSHHWLLVHVATQVARRPVT